MVCTLGNFSTKLLTGERTGITKVHGRPQTRELGGLTVQLYPLFHPAAALRTDPVLELLREDFARLPGLLEEARRSAVAPAAAPELGPGLPKDEAPADGSPAPEPPQLDLFE